MRLFIALVAAAVAAVCGSFVVLASTGSEPASEAPATAPYVGERTARTTAVPAPKTTTSPAPATSTSPVPKTVPRPMAVGRTVARQAAYVFPVGGCRGMYARGHHDYPAADIMAAVGCRFVSPVAGRVDEVSRGDRWDPRSNRGAERGGLSVSVIGVDGVRYYGSHLSAISPGIVPGARVRAGQELGRLGRSGSARNTPAHLHFGISWPTPSGHWWIRRGVVAPQPYLDAWQAKRQLSPAADVRRARARLGAPNPTMR